MRSETLDPIIAEKVRNLPRSYFTRDFSRGGAGLVVGPKRQNSQSMEAALQEVFTSQNNPRRNPQPPREQSKLAQMERRLAKLEATTPKYRNVWEAGKTYPPTAMVTYKGALWIVRSEKATAARPGRGPDWRLMTKTR